MPIEKLSAVMVSVSNTQASCEGDISVPSSSKHTSEKTQGCVKGVLVEIEKEERKALEVCFADDKQKELDLIVWEEVIKEEKEVREFRIVTDGTVRRTRDSTVQTGEEEDADKVRSLIEEFPNLKTGGGFTPRPPPLPKPDDVKIAPLEWTVVVYPRNQYEGRKVIRPSPCFNKPPLEGDWARHPCCGTVCAVRGTPLRAMTDRECFGPALM